MRWLYYLTIAVCLFVAGAFVYDLMARPPARPVENVEIRDGREVVVRHYYYPYYHPWYWCYGPSCCYGGPVTHHYYHGAPAPAPASSSPPAGHPPSRPAPAAGGTPLKASPAGKPVFTSRPASPRVRYGVRRR